MQHTPYDYETRTGVHPISWERFGELVRQMVEQLAAHGVDMVVGVARAGLLPATAVACALDVDMTPVRVTRRERGVVVREEPAWKVDVSPDVAGRVVAVIDEIASTGGTLLRVTERVRERGAAKIVTAAMVAHSWAQPMPDIVALVSDELVIFPWDRDLYRDGVWQMHPEIVEALKAQALGPDVLSS